MADPQLPAHAPRPREQLPITLFEGVVLAARADDGRIYIGLRDLCDSLGLKVSGQRRRILADGALHLTQFRVQVGRQFRSLDFLLLEDVPVWLLGIQQTRVSKGAQERFAYVKAYLVSAVQRAFAELTGFPDARSSEIEDLTDLDRIEQAFAQLTELGRRQEQVESSLERARGAFRDLRSLLAELHERIRELEHQVRAPLSPTQRGTVYRMVQEWGAARAEHNTNQASGIAIRRSWAELNAAFGVSTYTQLPAARYSEIIGYIKDQYRAVTGCDLEVVEQPGLEDVDGA
jgi:exonuclease VII small subunit